MLIWIKDLCLKQHVGDTKCATIKQGCDYKIAFMTVIRRMQRIRPPLYEERSWAGLASAIHHQVERLFTAGVKVPGTC